MSIRWFTRVAAASVVAALVPMAASCTSGSPAPALSRSPAPTGDVTTPTGPATPETPVPTTPATSGPQSTSPAPTSGGDLPDGFFISQPGTYQVETDRLVFDAGRIVEVAPKIWFGDSTPTKFPRGALVATSTGAFLSAGGTWTNASSRSLKEGFRPVDGAKVLRALGRLPVTTWRYRAEAAGVRHMGPMAEDFFRAFQLGPDARHIATVDSEGVALAAVRALVHRTTAQRHAIRALRARLLDLAVRVQHLERATRRGR